MSRYHQVCISSVIPCWYMEMHPSDETFRLYGMESSAQGWKIYEQFYQISIVLWEIDARLGLSNFASELKK